MEKMLFDDFSYKWGPHNTALQLHQHVDDKSEGTPIASFSMATDSGQEAIQSLCSHHVWL